MTTRLLMTGSGDARAWLSGLCHRNGVAKYAENKARQRGRPRIGAGAADFFSSKAPGLRSS